MGVIGLVTAVIAAGFGLYLLSIWLIEYDKDFQSVAATRLPAPLLAGHVLAAVSAVVLWVAFLAWNNDHLAWYSVIAFVLAASLGSTMAIRWISVYRASRAGARAGAMFMAAPTGYNARATEQGPPERNFPLTVVIVHGLFAVTTLTLVVVKAVDALGS